MQQIIEAAVRERKRERARERMEAEKKPGLKLSGRCRDFASELAANLRVNSLGDKLAELRRKYSWHYAYA